MHFTFVAALVLSAASIASATIKGVHYKTDPVNVKNTAERLGARDLERRATAKLTYYGGPVIGSVVVNPIWYGATVDTTKIQGFYTGVPNSAYFDMMSEYSTSSTKIQRGKFGVAYKEPSPSSSSSLSDATIQTYLKNLVKAGHIKPTANTYFPIHFGAKYSISMGGSNSCQSGGFCAYHGTIDISSLNVGTKYLYYGVIPDQYTTGCSSGCGTSPTPFNNLCSVSSHELAEMVTDPAVGLATANAAPLAWYDATNGEIGDICNAMEVGVFSLKRKKAGESLVERRGEKARMENRGWMSTVVGGNGVTYTVQKLWSNAKKACIV
ncbi:hypothetical protein HK101_003452 [Irineochytrium annulatum]|nr:hypothetical protein HK101_003452 [Irineochytrium annulatum]